MASRSHATGTLSMALLISLSIGSTAVAQAPETQTEPRMGETITVVAPRITYQVRRRQGGSAIPQEVTVAERSAMVDYSDLDLEQAEDLQKLEGRVSEAAARVCEELAKEFPDGQPSTPVCKSRAVEDAMAQAQLMARQTTQSQR